MILCVYVYVYVYTCVCVFAGQILELLGEQEENEHWWRVRDEDGSVGCVPASYVLKKEHQVIDTHLPGFHSLRGVNSARVTLPAPLPRVTMMSFLKH